MFFKLRLRALAADLQRVPGGVNLDSQNGPEERV